MRVKKSMIDNVLVLCFRPKLLEPWGGGAMTRVLIAVNGTAKPFQMRCQFWLVDTEIPDRVRIDFTASIQSN